MSGEAKAGEEEGSERGWLLRRVPLVENERVVEERANVVTHAVGALLSLAALVLLLRDGIASGSLRLAVALPLFGLSLLNLYVISTLYHLVGGPRAKRLFRILDHASIYFLIAGTYTPVALAFIGGSLGWLLFGLEWGLALLGILFKVFFLGRLRVVSVLFYVAMGWLILVVWKQLFAAVPLPMGEWLLAGGLFYTAGLLFYAWKRLPFNHAIWHLFVVCGSLCHLVALLVGVASQAR